MKLLYISSVSRINMGVTYSIPSEIKYQSKLDECAWIIQ